MSNKRDDFVYNHIYRPHLRGGSHENNPIKNQKVLSERMYVRVFTEMACNRFKWEGLPKSVDPRFLELTLFRSALSVFFYDDYNPATKKGGTDRFFALQGSGVGKWNMYDNPTKFQVTGNGMMQRTLHAGRHTETVGGEKLELGPECVPIWANYLRVPDWDIVTLFAARLAELDQTIQIAGMNMRNTNVVFSNENTRLSMQNFIRQRDEGQPTIFASNGLDLAQFGTVDMRQHPDTLPKLMIAKSKMWNECMTLLGINNANQDKRERVVSNEVEANDEQIEATRQIALNARQQACDQINDLYGDKLEEEISVDFHITKATNPVEEGMPNGDIYNPASSSGGTNGE